MKTLFGSLVPVVPTAAFLLATASSPVLLANGDDGEPPPAAGPSISIQVDGIWYQGPEIQRIVDESGKVMYGVEDFSIRNQDFEITLSALLNPDPSIAYAIGIADFGAPSAFAFLFSTPIVPTGSPNAVNASIVGGLTDFTGDGVSITPTGAAVQISSVFGPLTNMGVDVGPAQSNGPGSSGALYSYGAFAAGPIAGPGPGPWTGLQTATSFSLSGGGDLAALTGFAQIVETTILVPESGTGGSAVVLGTLVGAWCWRRRQTARA